VRKYLSFPGTHFFLQTDLCIDHIEIAIDFDHFAGRPDAVKKTIKYYNQLLTDRGVLQE
jgi:hypothetical protein